MGKKTRENSVNLDSFLDIMTCMVGILFLIILLTGIDASQIKVLIPTPMEVSTDKRPIFIECRNNQIFRVPLHEVSDLAHKRIEEIWNRHPDDMEGVLEDLSDEEIAVGAYRVDLTPYLASKYNLWPISSVEGFSINSVNDVNPSDWYGKLLSEMNANEEMLTFLVRDDSYRVFKIARALAWYKKIDVSFNLLDTDGPLKFGLGGEAPRVQ